MYTLNSPHYWYLCATDDNVWPPRRPAGWPPPWASRVLQHLAASHHRTANITITQRNFENPIQTPCPPRSQTLTVTAARNHRIQVVDDILARLPRLQSAALQLRERRLEEIVENEFHVVEFPSFRTPYAMLWRCWLLPRIRNFPKRRPDDLDLYDENVRACVRDNRKIDDGIKVNAPHRRTPPLSRCRRRRRRPLRQRNQRTACS